jgi:tetratricopeptide (TPR) repeat protein
MGYVKARQAGDQVVVNTALLLRARIYRDQNDLTRAEAMLAEVEPALRRNLPPGHYAFASLISEHALIALARGDLATALQLSQQALTIVEVSAHAAADGARAVTLLQAAAQPGTFSLDLGRTCLTLARALEAQHKRDEARLAYRSAFDHLNGAVGSDHPHTRLCESARRGFRDAAPLTSFTAPPKSS